MPGTILKKAVLPPPSQVADLVCQLDRKLQGNLPILDVLLAVDGARGPLVSYFSNHLKSRVEAMALTLKVLNLLVAKYHFHARSEAVFSRPFGLIVDPANGCNLACQVAFTLSIQKR
jgi:hypothetical protein